MAHDSVVSRIGMSITGAAAKRPRLAMTLVLLVMLVAAQGTVGAETIDFSEPIGTNGTGTIDSGP
jgi:hypothetical protein